MRGAPLLLCSLTSPWGLPHLPKRLRHLGLGEGLRTTALHVLDTLVPQPLVVFNGSSEAVTASGFALASVLSVTQPLSANALQMSSGRYF